MATFCPVCYPDVAKVFHAPATAHCLRLSNIAWPKAEAEGHIDKWEEPSQFLTL